MLVNLIAPIVRCFPRVVRARPRISAAAVAPVVRPLARVIARRAPRIAMVCTVAALPSAAPLSALPPPPVAPAAIAAPLAAPLAAPAALPFGIGAFPLLPSAYFPDGSGGGYSGAGLPSDPSPWTELPPPEVVMPPGGGVPPGGGLPPTDGTHTPVPEPASMFATGLLALLGALSVGRLRRRGESGLAA